MIMPFSIARLPRIEFGSGSIRKLPELAQQYGDRVLLITGRSSFMDSDKGSYLLQSFQNHNIHYDIIHVDGEPSPQWVDEQVQAVRVAQDNQEQSYHVVIGIGGGSPLDAAKAVAGLLKPGNSVMDHLEGVGPELPYSGDATPFIAVPTTAGTGSEATKNAVLSVHGDEGFKKSFRDDALVAEYAVIDPDLLASCPPEWIAANGMDAFTQLMESYVSIRANPITDALCLSGLKAVRASLLDWYQGDGDQDKARADMAYAALISGICLAQTGLGSVHGLAQPLGSFFPIPHGVVCGTTVAEATQVNIDAMEQRDPRNPALTKYAEIGRLMRGKHEMSPISARMYLVEALHEWTNKMNLQRLSAYGVQASDIDRIVQNSRGSSMKTNPVVLKDEEIAEIIRARL